MEPFAGNAHLPIDTVLPEIVSALRECPNLVLRAPTGAGKTTRVPLELWRSGLAGQGWVALVEPRRLAARAACSQMARQIGGQPGDLVGYMVRHEKRVSAASRVVAMTSGILLARLVADPTLEGIGAVVLDEFHERGIETDLILGMVRTIRETLRPDLKLVVMSATLDVSPLVAYLGDCRVVDSPGRLFPVTQLHEPMDRDTPLATAMARGVRRLLEETPGDLLAFLPGMGEIRATARALELIAADFAVDILPLHGDLPLEEQDRALRGGGRRRVVLATNVAESSVTVEGVTGVVDCATSRQLRHDPAVGLDRLEVRPISQASLTQRAGRAGRVAPGVCLRLCSESDARNRRPTDEPEVRRVDLAGPLLRLASLGELDSFEWLNPPSPAARALALEQLDALGAISQGKITGLGRRLASLPMSPQLGILLLAGMDYGVPGLAAATAAVLEEGDPRPRWPGHSPNPSSSDLLDILGLLEDFERGGRPDSLPGSRAKWLLRARDQVARLMGVRPGMEPVLDNAEALGLALLAAFPARLARRREPRSPRALLASGRGARLADSSAVREEELFIALDLMDAPGEAIIRLASGIDRSWLDPTGMQSQLDICFDEKTSRVETRKRLSWRGLLLEEVDHPTLRGEATAILLEAAAWQRRAFPRPETPAGHLLARWRWLAVESPGLVPPFDEALEREVLLGLCQGLRGLAELENADWLGALAGRLTHQQSRDLDTHAPDRICLPSGNSVALTYETGRLPVLAARIQELFGWKETPRIAQGKVRLLLHLLAPNYRPQQVTDDLASFWNNTYLQVRKDLRNRYPKHHWPEDPWTAVVRPRRK